MYRDRDRGQKLAWPRGFNAASKTLTKRKLYRARIRQQDFQIQSCSPTSSGRNPHCRLDVAETPAMSRYVTIEQTVYVKIIR